MIMFCCVLAAKILFIKEETAETVDCGGVTDVFKTGLAWALRSTASLRALCEN
jgi:hypothetical protein